MPQLKYNSPVEQLIDPLFTKKEINVFVKRDDYIHPFISGNKWRKLKYSLQKAEDEEKDHLVTFGGSWSNHLLATSCAAAKFGFKSTGIVRGEPVNNQLLTLCGIFGMDLKFADRESYRNKPAVYTNYFSGDDKTLFINEGGAGSEGIKGCSELIEELEREYDHIFCACGTGTTLAGIIKGLTSSGARTKVHGIPVLKNAQFLYQDIGAYLDNNNSFELHCEFHFGGYAKVTPELIWFIKDLAASTGMLTDPVYTGKLFFAVYDLIKKDHFKPGSTILVIHTGGLFGLLGMTEAFQEII